MARLCFLAVFIVIYSSALFVSAQDCSLPTIAQLEAVLPPLLVISDGNQVYSPNVTEGSVQYVCLAQGDMIDTYKAIALIANFTSNPEEPEQTRIFDIECSSGTWSGRTGSLDPPPASVVGVPPRTDCYRCREGFGGDTRCRACDGACNSGLMRCTGSGSGDCCSAFSSDGRCITNTNCTSSSGPNYVATESNNFTCSCNLTCPNGFTVNSNCTDCDLVSICNASNPCMNGGRCIQNSPADNYTCDCTGTGHEGVNCTVMLSSTPSPTPSSTPVPSSTPSPSPSPVCTSIISNCASCQNSSCCKNCNPGSYLTDGCTCGPCTVPNCLRCELLNSRCCVACETGYEASDCGCEIMSSSVKPPEPTSTPERPSETTGFSTGTLIGVIIGTILGILLLLTLAAVVAYVIYYVAVGGGAAVTKAKPKSPFANGESHNNPLYLAPDDVAGEVAD